jgi:hypothetical protein
LVLLSQEVAKLRGEFDVPSSCDGSRVSGLQLAERAKPNNGKNREGSLGRAIQTMTTGARLKKNAAMDALNQADVKSELMALTGISKEVSAWRDVGIRSVNDTISSFMTNDFLTCRQKATCLYFKTFAVVPLPSTLRLAADLCLRAPTVEQFESLFKKYVVAAWDKECIARIGVAAAQWGGGGLKEDVEVQLLPLCEGSFSDGDTLSTRMLKAMMRAAARLDGASALDVATSLSSADGKWAVQKRVEALQAISSPKGAIDEARLGILSLLANNNNSFSDLVEKEASALRASINLEVELKEDSSIIKPKAVSPPPLPASTTRPVGKEVKANQSQGKKNANGKPPQANQSQGKKNANGKPPQANQSQGKKHANGKPPKANQSQGKKHANGKPPQANQSQGKKYANGKPPQANQSLEEQNANGKPPQANQSLEEQNANGKPPQANQSLEEKNANGKPPQANQSLGIMLTTTKSFAGNGTAPGPPTNSSRGGKNQAARKRGATDRREVFKYLRAMKVSTHLSPQGRAALVGATSNSQLMYQQVSSTRSFSVALSAPLSFAEQVNVRLAPLRGFPFASSNTSAKWSNKTFSTVDEALTAISDAGEPSVLEMVSQVDSIVRALLSDFDPSAYGLGVLSYITEKAEALTRARAPQRSLLSEASDMGESSKQTVGGDDAIVRLLRCGEIVTDVRVSMLSNTKDATQPRQFAAYMAVCFMRFLAHESVAHELTVEQRVRSELNALALRSSEVVKEEACYKELASISNARDAKGIVAALRFEGAPTAEIDDAADLLLACRTISAAAFRAQLDNYLAAMASDRVVCGTMEGREVQLRCPSIDVYRRIVNVTNADKAAAWRSATSEAAL